MTWDDAWPSQVLQTSRNRLAQLRDTALNLPKETNEEVSAAVSKFLVVRSAGHIEFTVDECIHSYAVSKAHPQIAQYVRSGLFSGRNPSPGKLVAHVQKVSQEWAKQLDDYLDADDQAIKRELEFLVDRRNKIAHGQSESVNLRKSLDLCKMALAIGDWAVETMDPR
jgi:hypothetical protein